MSLTLAPAAALAANPEVLNEIRSEDCNLAIWERALSKDFSALIAGEAHDIRFESDLTGLAPALSAALPQAGFGARHLQGALIADIAALAGHFCSALGLARFEVRLEAVTTDSCRKFHADYVRARLITTYVGPGTDWLDSKQASRLAEGLEPSQINRMQAGDVGLFKGKLATLHPAIHRSPPISETGEKRLLLVLNPVEQRRDLPKL
ncbi:MAG: DUF1826 domain-containing protein [Erythrobacter sp.]